MDGQVEIGRLIWLNSRKVRRRHADDRIGEILNRKRLTDDFFIRVKRTSPVVKAQNDNGGTVLAFIIAWSKEMAENCRLFSDASLPAAWTSMSCSGFWTGNLRSSRGSRTENTAVFAPIASARVATAVAVNPGF